jgi:hypothetical protein
MEQGFLVKLVMAGLVPGIHVLAALKQERRGWPGHLARRRASRFLPGHDEIRIIFEWLERA